MSSNLPNKNSSSGLNPIGDAKKILNARNQVFKPINEHRITRNNPCAIVILIDQSGSMGRSFWDSKNEPKIMAIEVADAINNIFEHLIMKSTRGDGVREYFTFSLIGYGNEQEEDYASFVWEGKLEGKEWVTVKELSENILDIVTKIETAVHPWGEEYQKRTIEKKWINPNAEGKNTPMLSALRLCKEKLEQFIEERSDNYPPIVFNLTDGIPTDTSDLDELESICSEIKNIETSFGNTILFNCLLSPLNNSKLFLPTVGEFEKISENKYHAALFNSSSVLPNFILDEAYKMFNDEKYKSNEPIKSLVLNVKPRDLTKLFYIGTNTKLSS
jgi:hypothetical protein